MNNNFWGEYKKTSKEMLQIDKIFLVQLAMSLEHYAALCHQLKLDEIPGCRDPINAKLLRDEVARRLEELNEWRVKS